MATTKKKRMGRPPAADGHVRMFIRGTEEDFAAWRQAAERDGISLTAWVRMTLNRSVRIQSALAAQG